MVLRLAVALLLLLLLLGELLLLICASVPHRSAAQ